MVHVVFESLVGCASGILGWAGASYVRRLRARRAYLADYDARWREAGGPYREPAPTPPAADEEKMAARARAFVDDVFPSPGGFLVRPYDGTNGDCPFCQSGRTYRASRCEGTWFFGRKCPGTCAHRHCHCYACEGRWLEATGDAELKEPRRFA